MASIFIYTQWMEHSEYRSQQSLTSCYLHGCGLQILNWCQIGTSLNVFKACASLQILDQHAPCPVFSGVFREATTDFTVDARALTQTGGNHIKTLISNPSGSCTDALITDLGDGTYNVEYTPYEEGEFQSSSVCRICRFVIGSSDTYSLKVLMMFLCFRPTQC